MMKEDHTGIIERLCPELKTILDAELAAGNTIAESWDDWGLAVMLARPFVLTHPLPEEVEFHEVNDPHYWLAEYNVRALDQFIACRF